MIQRVFYLLGHPQYFAGFFIPYNRYCSHKNRPSCSGTKNSFDKNYMAKNLQQAVSDQFSHAYSLQDFLRWQTKNIHSSFYWEPVSLCKIKSKSALTYRRGVDFLKDLRWWTKDVCPEGWHQSAPRKHRSQRRNECVEEPRGDKT